MAILTDGGVTDLAIVECRDGAVFSQLAFLRLHFTTESAYGWANCVKLWGGSIDLCGYPGGGSLSARSTTSISSSIENADLVR